jgi:hypothetical protein
MQVGLFLKEERKKLFFLFLKMVCHYRMEDKWMNDSLVVYIKKDIFDNIDNEIIMKWFQNIKTPKEQL